MGLGLHGAEGITLLGLDLVKKADVVYLDGYTSPFAAEALEALCRISGRDVKVVGREFLEDGRSVLKEASEGDVVLIALGDPMVATTHMDLRVRAELKGVKTKVIHNSSILNALPGETGLHIYSFGKAVTMTRGGPTSNTAVYNTVHQNLVRGLHTPILLEYDQAEGFYLKPNDAMKILLEAEDCFKQGVFNRNTFILIASRVGSEDQSIVGGEVETLLKIDFSDPPHILLVLGELHFSEVEALKTLLKIGDVHGNSSGVRVSAVNMVLRYLEKSRRALAKARVKVKEEAKTGFEDLFENVECYLYDSERFLNEGRFELAILSLGYAEGLLDSLRFIGQLEVEW